MGQFVDNDTGLVEVGADGEFQGSRIETLDGGWVVEEGRAEDEDASTVVVEESSAYAAGVAGIAFAERVARNVDAVVTAGRLPGIVSIYWFNSG